MLLYRLPENCIAECTFSPRDSVIRCGDIVLRLADGTYSPTIDTSHPTIASREYQRAAGFTVLAAGLTVDDWRIWRANETARTSGIGDIVYGRHMLAKMIRAAIDGRQAIATLTGIAAELGIY
jgi:hypothetical protein